jgi:hypothetical protein
MSWFSTKTQNRAKFEPVPIGALSENNSERYKQVPRQTLNVRNTKYFYPARPNPLVIKNYVVPTAMTRQPSFFKATRSRKRKTHKRQTRRV